MKTKELNSEYIFLTENFKDGVTKYFAILPEQIEELNVSDTYDQFGQLVDAGNAGDSIELLSLSAVDIANGEDNEDDYKTYEIDSIISAYDNYQTFNLVQETPYLKEGKDYNSYKEICKGFTFWNGNNWKTVTVQVENGESSHEIIRDEELIKELNQAIENKEFEKEGFGTKIYTSDGWVIIDNYCSGAWASYEILSSEDYDFRNQSEADFKRQY